MTYAALIVIVAGLLMYLLCSNTKACEIGRMLFFAAAIGFLIALAPLTVNAFHG